MRQVVAGWLRRMADRLDGAKPDERRVKVARQERVLSPGFRHERFNEFAKANQG